MATTYNPRTVVGGLVLHLDAANQKSYAGSGTTWTDLSGTSNHATLVNGPVFNAGNGGHITFDGTNDHALVASSQSFNFGTGDFTLEAWIRAESFAGFTHILGFPDQGVFAFKANTGDGDIYVYAPEYTTYGSTPGWRLVLNTWQHVVFKREASVGSGFLNGQLKGSVAGFTKNLGATSVRIHDGWYYEFVQTSMSVIRIYNRALSTSEVVQNFNAARSRYGV